MPNILKIKPIDNWLKKNNWNYYNHQIETLKLSENGFDVLLVAPTGGGKTLASFLPSLNDLINNTTGFTGVEALENGLVDGNLYKDETPQLFNYYNDLPEKISGAAYSKIPASSLNLRTESRIPA